MTTSYFFVTVPPLHKQTFKEGNNEKDVTSVATRPGSGNQHPSKQVIFHCKGTRRVNNIHKVRAVKHLTFFRCQAEINISRYGYDSSFIIVIYQRYGCKRPEEGNKHYKIQ